MSNPTLASITAELEAVETAARGRGSLTCDHLAGRIANIRGELQQIAQPQPPAEAQPVAWGSLFSECICNGGKAGCPGCNPDKAIELAVAIATHDERRKHPPCMECGAATPKEAETKCICSGDKDDCHGCELWPDPDDSEAPSAAVGVEADAAGEDILTRALNSAYEHGARQAVFPLSDCARQVRETLAQQPAAVDDAVATASDRDLLKMVASATGLTWRKDIEEERAAKNVLGLWITNQDGSLGNTAWNPLHSSSDAFHLAVELGISVCVRGDAAATRRAIVHAALAAQQGGES